MDGRTMTSNDARIAWIDYAKGICIVAVVGLYATIYVEGLAGAQGWMSYWVEFARPFRMPDFFLISGLFLARTIDRPWRTYLDKKVIHFVFFFALWTTIYFVAAALGGELEGDRPLWAEYLWWYADPFHMLWFIAMLPVYFLAARLLRPIPWPIVLVAAALLQMWHPETGFRQIDRFGERFVYFYAGYCLAPAFFSIASWAKDHAAIAVFILAGWAIVNGWFVVMEFADAPGIGLALGFVGSMAVISAGSLLSGSRMMDWLRYLGEHSIVVFLSFFVFMVVAARGLASLELIGDVGSATLLVTALSIAGSVALYWVTRRFSMTRFLFERPRWAQLRPSSPPSAVQASNAAPIVSTMPPDVAGLAGTPVRSALPIEAVGPTQIRK